MRRRDIVTSSTRLISWTHRVRKDLSREISALHVKELDLAFMATNKGMIYAPPEPLIEADEREPKRT